MTNDQTVTQALDFIDKFFEPWGSWKTAWWEGEVSDDAAFSADNALKHVANILRRTTHSGEGRSNGAGEDGLSSALAEHFPTGIRGLYEQSAQGIPVKTHVGTNCLCGWCTSATDEQEVREEWAAHVAAALSAPQGEVERLRAAALTDDPNWICAGIPDHAIEAGIEVFRQVERDSESYVAGETTDWDEGMMVAAIFKAVARSILAQPEVGGEQ